MSGLRTIVLDFDGVVLESVDVKTRAFVELFADYPEHRRAIERLHLENAGMSRYEKFVRIHEDLLGRACPEEEQGRLGERFSEIVYREILTCPFVPGARAFLDWAGARYELHVASATPHEEILDIVSRRGLAGHFASVWGAPHRKADVLRTVCAGERALYVGDALGDYAAAREAAVPFVLRQAGENAGAFPTDGVVLVVRDLAELAARWDEVIAAIDSFDG